MKNEDILSGLDALEERVAIAKREIKHISAFDSLQKRVWVLEQELEEIKNKLKQNG